MSESESGAAVGDIAQALGRVKSALAEASSRIFPGIPGLLRSEKELESLIQRAAEVEQELKVPGADVSKVFGGFVEDVIAALRRADREMFELQVLGLLCRLPEPLRKAVVDSLLSRLRREVLSELAGRGGTAPSKRQEECVDMVLRRQGEMWLSLFEPAGHKESGG